MTLFDFCSDFYYTEYLVNFILTQFFVQGVHKLESADRGVPGAMAPDINSFPDQQTSFTQERWFDFGNLGFSFVLISLFIAPKF